MIALLSLVSFGILYLVRHKSLSLTINSGRQIHAAKEELWHAMTIKVDSWGDALGNPIDSKIKDTVIVLNLIGFETVQSCEGHQDWGNPYPWVSFSDENEEIKLIIQKGREVQEKIDKEQQKLMEKYPNTTLSEIDVETVAPELILLRRQIRELRAQMKRLSRMKIIALKELIGSFYKKQIVNYDRILFLSDSVISQYWLMSIGASWQDARNEEIKLKKLKEYQEEMNSFTQFLKDYYWSEKFNPFPEWPRIPFKAPSHYFSGATAKKSGMIIDRTEKDEIWSLFAGFKDVCWIGVDLEILKGYIQGYGKLYQDIRCAVIKNPGFPSSYIVYSLPKGEKFALLFAKQAMEKTGNPYLTGHLLGYDDEDIKYFYEKDQNKQEGLNEYLKANEAAEQFISANAGTIQQWAKENNIRVIYSWPEE